MRAIALQTEIGVFTAFPIIFRMRTVKYLNSGENASILFSDYVVSTGYPSDMPVPVRHGHGHGD